MSTEENRIRLTKFLKFVFSVENPIALYGKTFSKFLFFRSFGVYLFFSGMLVHAIHDPNNKTDLDIYAGLRSILDERSMQTPLAILRQIRTFRQLQEQRSEFVNETMNILKNLGAM